MCTDYKHTKITHILILTKLANVLIGCKLELKLMFRWVVNDMMYSESLFIGYVIIIIGYYWLCEIDKAKTSSFIMCVSSAGCH